MFQTVSGLPNLPTLKTLNLSGRRHYILPNKDIVPSVTTVLDHFNQTGIRRWKWRVGHEEANKISLQARDRGEGYHTIVERYLQNIPIVNILQLSEVIAIPSLKQSLYDTIPYLDRINNIHYQETCLFSSALRIAGRCDLIAEFDGELAVIDFKTSRKPKEEKYIQHYFEQATCYSLMYGELIGVDISKIVVMIAADTEDGDCIIQCFERNPRDYEDSLRRKIEAYYSGMEL
jgi:hypothetical protein